MSLRNTNGNYFTRNLYLAAYLKAGAMWYEQTEYGRFEKQMKAYDVRVEQELNGRFSFLVEIDDRLEELIDNFFKNEGMCDPIAYSYALKSIKKEMYEPAESGENQD